MLDPCRVEPDEVPANSEAEGHEGDGDDGDPAEQLKDRVEVK